MPMIATDIAWYLSGGAGNASPAASLGGARSSTAWAGGTLHDLFDAVSADENVASDAEYRCVYIRNEHATLTALSGRLYVASETASGAVVALALAGEGKNGTAETVANENTAPSGETFSAPTTKETGLVVPDLAPGDTHAVWIRRTAANTAAVSNDGATIRFAFESEA